MTQDDLKSMTALETQVEIAKENGSLWIQVDVAQLESLLRRLQPEGREDEHELGDPLWPVYQKFIKETKPNPMPTYSGWLRQVANRMEAVAHSSSAGPEPRCPKCGGTCFDVIGDDVNCQSWIRGDNPPDTATLCRYRGKLRAFFPASQQERESDVPICMHCGCYEGAHRGNLKFCPGIFGAHTYKQSAGPVEQDRIRELEQQLAAMREKREAAVVQAAAWEQECKRLEAQLAASQQVDVREIKLPNWPDYWGLFVNEVEVERFTYEHDANRVAAVLRKAIGG